MTADEVQYKEGSHKQTFYARMKDSNPKDVKIIVGRCKIIHIEIHQRTTLSLAIWHPFQPRARGELRHCVWFPPFSSPTIPQLNSELYYNSIFTSQTEAYKIVKKKQKHRFYIHKKTLLQKHNIQQKDREKIELFFSSGFCLKNWKDGKRKRSLVEILAFIRQRKCR